MNKSLRALPLPASLMFLSKNGFLSEAQEIRRSFPGKGITGIRARKGWAVDVLKSKGLFDKFVLEHWSTGGTPEAKKYLDRYRDCFDALKEEKPESSTDDPAADHFAYERDLRNYLAANPAVIEQGLSLWPVAEGETAVEFVVDGGRRIDILARDRQGVPVIIELKVSRGHEPVIGQALYYRGCIKEKFTAQRVRIVIIAREMTPELKIATKDLADVELFEYRLSVNLTKLVRPTAAATAAQ